MTAPARPQPTSGQLARVREATYQAISLTFAPPHDTRATQLTALADHLDAAHDLAAHFAWYGDWCALIAASRQLATHDMPALDDAYLRVFAIGVGAQSCPPYESVYRNPAGTLDGEVLGRVEQIYAAAGARTTAGGGDLADHVAVEAAFVAFLCGSEATAWEANRPAEAARARRRQYAFLAHHLADWFPAFHRRLRTFPGAAPYHALAAATQAFLAYDADLMRLLSEVAGDPVEERSRP